MSDKENSFTPKLPEVKFNKNGYEIRADVLATVSYTHLTLPTIYSV